MLSICIPTYNRFAFLNWTLAKTYADFPDAKIIVSDNASTDSTMRIDPIRIRFIRQSTNIGAFPNMRAAILASHTKYCTFLADDDYLLPDEVQKGIDFLESHPEVVGYFAPCQLYNEVEKRIDWDAFYVANDTTFTAPDALWNFIIQHHVWPEHVIWRREALDRIMLPRMRAYWCFLDLARAFAVGAVHFAKTPFYRNLTGHPVGARDKLGDAQCLIHFDEYRAGLEELAYDLFLGKMSEQVKTAVNNGIRAFIYARIEVAQRLLAARGQVAEAASYAKRLAIM